jgi:hypothetical protein
MVRFANLLKYIPPLFDCTRNPIAESLWRRRGTRGSMWRRNRPLAQGGGFALSDLGVLLLEGIVYRYGDRCGDEIVRRSTRGRRAMRL